MRLEAEGWSPSKRRAYELESLEQTRAHLQTMAEDPNRPPSQYEILEVELRGEYPETVIHVRYRDPYAPQVRWRDYGLWRSAVRPGERGSFTTSEGVQESPPTVGLFICTWVHGG